MQFGQGRKPNMDGVNLLISILVCYPEIGAVSYEPKDDALHFSFTLRELPSRAEYESVGELIRESILTYHSLEGFEGARIEIFLEGAGPYGVLPSHPRYADHLPGRDRHGCDADAGALRKDADRRRRGPYRGGGV